MHRYAGTPFGKHCTKLNGIDEDTDGKGKLTTTTATTTAGSGYAQISFTTLHAGQAVWQIQPRHARPDDFVSVTIQVVPRSRLSAFEDFVDLATAPGAGRDFDKVWNHDYVQTVLRMGRPVDT